MSMMTPREITSELDKHIVGQNDAKRAVAIALRNRWRRLRLDEEMRGEITPKNILMIGPTGVGKTEIARRLARLSKAPFIKVEATKFTEVGYVGRDVESIIRDLVDEAIKMLREKEIQKVENLAMDRAEERILDVLLPRAREREGEARDSGARQMYRKKLREGELDEKEIELQLAEQSAGIEIMGAAGARRHDQPVEDDVFQHEQRPQEVAADAGGRGLEGADRGRTGEAGRRGGYPRARGGNHRTDRHRFSR